MLQTILRKSASSVKRLNLGKFENPPANPTELIWPGLFLPGKMHFMMHLFCFYAKGGEVDERVELGKQSTPQVYLDACPENIFHHRGRTIFVSHADMPRLEIWF